MERVLSKLREGLWKVPINKALKAELNLPLASARHLPCFLQASFQPWFEMLLGDDAPLIPQARSPSTRGARVRLPSSTAQSPRATLGATRDSVAGVRVMSGKTTWRIEADAEQQPSKISIGDIAFPLPTSEKMSHYNLPAVVAHSYKGTWK